MNYCPHVYNFIIFLGKPADIFDEDNPDWIPNLKLGYGDPNGESGNSAMERYKRAKGRKVLLEMQADEVMQEDEMMQEAEEESQDATTAVDQSTQTDMSMADIDALIKANQDYVQDVVKLKAQVKKQQLSEEAFKEDDEKVRYYTGMHTFNVFQVVYDIAAPYITETPRSSLNKFQQLLLTFMRLRLNLDFHDLAYRFGVCQTTSSKVFYACLHVLFERLKQFVVWPDRDTLRCRVPPVFQEAFGKRVTVVIDCFEIEIEKSSNPMAQCQTWSNYKARNTAKYLIGICPQGTICFISKAWGGRASDKHITENCGILDKLIPHDLILADRGFDIKDTVGLYCCEVKFPAFKHGKKQLGALDIEKTRSLASVRIHVERVIGVLRQKFRILEGRMPLVIVSEIQDEVSAIDKILTVTSALVNLCPSLMSFD